MSPSRAFGRRFIVIAVLLSVWWTGVSAEEFRSISWVPQADRAALVHVPEGTKRVRLQSRAATGEPWITVGIVHLDGRAGTVKLRLPDGVALGDIAVETSGTDPFPHSFYQGKSSFDTTASLPPGVVRGGDVLAPMENTDAGMDGPAGPSAVQESDIWKWRGRVLYYFNTLRGLQVFDLSDFEHPRRIGGLRLPAVGEDMYLLGSEHVVLLANRPAYGWESDAASGPRSEVVVMRHAGTDVSEVTRVGIDGAFMESRLIGSTLCLVTQKTVTIPRPDGQVTYVAKQQVHTIDLSDPARPQVHGPVDLTPDDGSWSWQPVVQATSEFLFIATNAWSQEGKAQTRLHVIDLRSPGQPLAVAAQLPLAGQVRHRFQISYANGIVTTVSESGGAIIETWDLNRALLGTGPAAPKPLDALLVGANESLFATRFDGTRVYVVTFRRIDPLFCVDLANPADLRLLGELEVPGFSTYLDVFADGARLLSLGVEDSRVAVSLFDVADPAAPALKARVRFGDGEHWSWSEGNYDDKAIGFFRDAGLLLFPLQEWSPEHGYRAGMQLVDATADGLKARGFIDHRFSARRGRLFDQTLVSIGSQELLVLDLADRDAPRLVSSLTVAWPVRSAVPYGDSLVQLEDGDQVAYPGDWNQPARHVHLRLTSQSDLDVPVAELDLGSPGQIAGTAIRGDTLYVLVRTVDGRSVPGADGAVTIEWISSMSVLVVDLAAPGGPRLTGAVSSRQDGYTWGYGRLESHWLPDGRLLWFPAESTGGSFYWRCQMCPVGVAGGAALDDGMVGMPWRWGGSQTDDILVVDVSDAAKPRVASRVPVIAKDENASSSRVYLSADTRLLASWSTWSVTEGVWSEQSRVQEIDLTDSAAPRRGRATAVPSLVQGIHRTGGGGLVLFASRPEVTSAPDKTITWTGSALVDALAYDGAQAFLLDTIRVEGAAHLPAVVSGPHFLILLPSVDENPGSALRPLAWEPATGKWKPLPDLALAARWPAMMQRGGFLFVSDSYRMESFAVHQLPDAPARATQPLDTPVWDTSGLTLDVPGRAAWLPVDAYGVEKIDLGALPRPPVPVRRAPRDQSPTEWQSLALLPVDVVTAHGRDGGTLPIAVDADFGFAADGDAVDYEAWAGFHFEDPAHSPAGALDDPDHDGFGNYAEWAFGTSPDDATSQPEITVALIPGDAGQPARLILVARLNPLAAVENAAAAPRLALTPQFSADMQHWRTPRPDEIQTSATSIRRLWSLVVPAEVSSVFGRLDLAVVTDLRSE